MKHQLFSFLLKLVGFTLCIFFWNESYFWWIMSNWLLVFAFYLFISSYKIQYNFHIRSINDFDREGVLLTFDDGPDPETTPQILNILKEHNIKATFFVIGSKLKKNAELLRQIYQEGHVIGNHSNSHHNLIPFFSVKKLTGDFDSCASQVKEIIGKKPLLIRPPFGVTSPKYYQLLRKVKYRSIGWSVRSLDTSIKDADKLLQRIVSKIDSTRGEIVLLHDTQHITIQTLPRLIQQLKEKGIKFVTPQDALSIRVYEED